MHTLSVFLQLLQTYVVVITAHTRQFITLTPIYDIYMGASISIINNSNSVTISKNQWEVISKSPNEWFMQLHLNSQWGFHKYFISIINIILDSPTIAGPTTFQDIIIGITVPNSNKYTMVDLNWDGINKIIPTYDTLNDPQTFMNQTHYKNISENGIEMLPVSNGQTIAFPMRINLINYPKYIYANEQSYIQYEHYGSDVLQSYNCEPFDTEKGLDIYFGLGMGNILLNSFTIQYTVDTNVSSSSSSSSSSDSDDEPRLLTFPPDSSESSSDSDSDSDSDSSNDSSNESSSSGVSEAKEKWNKYLGVWVIVLSVFLTCVIIGILLYCSKYDISREKQIEKDRKIHFEEKQKLVTPSNIKSVEITYYSEGDTALNRMNTTTSDFSD